ncbi:aerobic respiration control sensor protein arcB [Karstenula rhodostoma CBS 690.94]|uniref:Aerobic respiration control sensor protein arcB n=1 Tax=Karstenula rhodostoma CBS 690.94 TaxID=1392251 RepID=A0A9P4PP06_9PLEO|nr:aerobic respiration control sensor protein arcB [Karstenula rhodostoma CBS 690.94]
MVEPAPTHLLSQSQSAPFEEPAGDAKRAFDHKALKELDGIGFHEVLDQDPRPTFVLDLDSDHLDYTETKTTLRPIFCNAALRLHEQLLGRITGSNVESGHAKSARTPYLHFKSWVTSISDFDDSRDVFPQTFFYEDMLWTGFTSKQRWRFVSGIQWGNATHHVSDISSTHQRSEGVKWQAESRDALVRKKLRPSEDTLAPAIAASAASVSEPPLGVATPQTELTVRSSFLLSSAPTFPNDGKGRSYDPTTGEASNDTSGSGASITLASPENGVPDWTAAKPQGVLTEHMMFARNVDWITTPLGSMDTWSVEFREVANLLMKNPHPAALFWGEELTVLYNEAYKNEVAGNKHPDLMGTGFSGPFSEIWDGVGPILRECARTGQSVRKENDYLPIERYGYLEETFFSWSFIPLYGGTKRILGFYNAPFETTYQTVSHRRMRTLRQISEKLVETRSTKHFWQCVLDGLQDNPWEVPFALLYSITDSDDADTVSHSSDSTISMKTCLLEGAIGIPEGHPASPPKLDLKRSKEGFIPAFREAMRTREPTIIKRRNGSLPDELTEGIEWRGYGDPCKEAIIIPVRPTNNENIFAFLLLGVNPKRAYDEEYKAFVYLLNRQLANSLASFLLFEEEVRRNRNAVEVATLQREQLSQQLEVQANRMRRMTELSPLGMYLFDPDGVLLEANERYYEMAKHERDDDSHFAFLKPMSEESRRRGEVMWSKMMEDYKPRQEEFHLTGTDYVPRDLAGEPIEYWVLATSQPEVDAHGKVKSIMGSIADISHLKWVQGLQEQRLKEAEETKRQQNEFIDITSHEMRNPLSAILICADDIRDSLSQHLFGNSDAKVVEECIDAANNIALCVQHQKSIVDDILTVSKLDSNLLLITPIAVQPSAIIHRAMNMFKPEVQSKEIELSFFSHESLSQLRVDWVYLDPSRLLQIIINLIGNAVKFTAGSEKRFISVHLGASTEQPRPHFKGFEYIPTRSSLVDIAAGQDWGDGERLYIRVKVEDTGVGLTVDEKRLLFERFAQASPRTHATYGGSGLGLFISRQLAELHGGQVGVSSEAGVGSTFGFFIQGRKAPTPKRPGIMGPTPLMRPQETIATHASVRSNSSPASISSTARSGPSVDDSDLAVLIVEDNLVNQRVLSKQLKKAGCTVYTADNGFLALEVLATTSFQDPAGRPLSIILMDLEMPEMDGLTAVGRIRDMEAEGVVTGHVPVIAVTANVRDEQTRVAIEGGMDDVVGKPFRVPELLAKVRSVLARLGGG